MTLGLVITACILFLLAGLGVPAGRVSLGWLGLACWSLSSIWHTLA